MTLLAGDLTTPQRCAVWLPNPPTLPSAILTQLVTSMTALIYNKLNRSRLYSQSFTRTFDGVGTMQLVLPDWPVTSVTQLQMGAALVQPSPLPAVVNGVVNSTTSSGYGYRYVPWLGNLPGDPSVLELVGGYFWLGAQNIKVAYNAGYLIQNEAQTVPNEEEPTITVLQPQGIWCRDNGVTYADGTALIPVASDPTTGQYVAPPDATPGLYTFSSGDIGAALLFNYSFIPADLEEATIQMVAERYSYRSRIGEISKSLGGQEVMRWLRGSANRFYDSNLPPEVQDLIQPYISVTPPAIGAPV